MASALDPAQHLGKEPFRRRKNWEVRKKESLANVEPCTGKPPKKKNSDNTQEITITRLTNPKKVESSVIEVQTDFDDNIKEIKTDGDESGSNELLAKFPVHSPVVISPPQLSPNDRKYTRNAEISTISPSMRETETQVESNEIAVQHAEVGTETEPADVIDPIKRTVDIGIQTGNIILEQKDTPPTMTSIAIQADKPGEMEETENSYLKSEDVNHSTHKNLHPSDMNIESLPVSLPLLRDKASKPPNTVSQADNNAVKRSPLSNGATSDSETVPQEKGLRKGRTRAQRKANRTEPALQCCINKTGSSKEKEETAANTDQPIESGSSANVSVEPASPSLITPAHVSVIKRTPEKRGGSRPFSRPRDMIIPAIDTAQIDVLLNDSPSPERESNKQNKNSKSPKTSNQSQRSPKTGSNPPLTEVQAEPSQSVNSHKPKQIPVKKGRGRPRKRPRPEEGSTDESISGEVHTDKVQLSKNNIPEEVQNNTLSENNQTMQPNIPPPSKKSRSVKRGAKLPLQNQQQKGGRKRNSSFQGKKLCNSKTGRREQSQPKITQYIKKKNSTKLPLKAARERTVFPPAFPEKDPYDFDTLSTSDFEPLPDLRQRRKRRKSKGFAFELEMRKKKKKKTVPQM